MTAFDIAVLVIVALSALGGLSRGFVHEVLALAAWVAAVVAIYLFHGVLTDLILGFFADNGLNAALVAFILLLLVPLFVMRALARWAGSKTRESALGFVDRVLGLGFGLVKGIVLVVLTFSIIALGYDTAWSAEGRPEWVTKARVYPFVHAASNELVDTVSKRKDLLLEEREAAQKEEA
ncbi:CvpA family protein [Croceicoccus naphthovorans]|uniref:Colicin V production protein n=1 Tax=Croceicoccus naphthovorans TaxID=1348774 RepID=A0A0G3XFP0_9SPHN|nr:CvpA family protein [Croceicoccus naphthovorans]AKM10017.1 colicin V production protein [Croceicoccus naphthovorans]MBB3991102.1 membrane protein required for colicin V production [Croceicoccus naphthovorans]